MKRVLLYGAIGGALLALLQIFEYKRLLYSYPGEVYGGVIALIFTGVGVWAAMHWIRPKEVEVVVVKEVPVVVEALPFAPNGKALEELGITPREFEILQLIAEGLSNREIGERLFVSENTVKTHSSRLFDKMSVSRRVQAVQKGRELGLIR